MAASEEPDVFTITIQSLSGDDVFDFQIKRKINSNILRYAVMYQLLVSKNPAYSADELTKWMTEHRRLSFGMSERFRGSFERVVLICTNGEDKLVYDDNKKSQIIEYPQEGDRWFYLIETMIIDHSNYLFYDDGSLYYDNPIACSTAFMCMDLGLPLENNMPSTPEAKELLEITPKYWEIFEKT